MLHNSPPQKNLVSEIKKLPPFRRDEGICPSMRIPSPTLRRARSDYSISPCGSAWWCSWSTSPPSPGSEPGTPSIPGSPRRRVPERALSSRQPHTSEAGIRGTPDALRQAPELTRACKPPSRPFHNRVGANVPRGQLPP
jgi:hypothetical protein